MLIYEYKVDGNKQQFAAIEEAIRVMQFVRNKCLRKWMDERGVSKNDLQCYCAVLAHEYSFASRLNSQARQAAGERFTVPELLSDVIGKLLKAQTIEQARQILMQLDQIPDTPHPDARKMSGC